MPDDVMPPDEERKRVRVPGKKKPKPSKPKYEEDDVPTRFVPAPTGQAMVRRKRKLGLIK